MKLPDILIDSRQEDNVYLYEPESGLCMGAFKTIEDAKNHIDAFAEIVLTEKYTPLYKVD